MASKQSSMDKYSNMAAVTATPGSADAFASTKFAFPFSIMDKVGLLLSRIEYFVNTLSGLNGGTDYIYAGLATAASLASIADSADPLMVDSIRLVRVDMGTAASSLIFELPLVRDFSNLPGGGLLVAPNPLYLWTQSNGAGAVMTVSCRLWYTYIEMAPDEYWQLVESRRVISS